VIFWGLVNRGWTWLLAALRAAGLLGEQQIRHDRGSNQLVRIRQVVWIGRSAMRAMCFPLVENGLVRLTILAFKRHRAGLAHSITVAQSSSERGLSQNA